MGILFSFLSMKKRMVIALGGNALIQKGQKGTIYEQFANMRRITPSLIRIIQSGWELVLSHGNGPQVGYILLQNELTRKVTPAMPLGICVAETQGFIGYMMQQCIKNEFVRKKINKEVVTLITKVLVDEHDLLLTHPTKPIGPYYTSQQAQKMKQDGYQMIQQQQGWRIVVPSPDPKTIVEGSVIKKLLEQGVLVIAAGGGGMPVIQKTDGTLDGLEAVVDKDLAVERLAEQIDAELLLILTNVEKVYLQYNSPQQKDIDTISLKEIKKLYENNEFPPGSMGPKIHAAIRFLEQGGKKVIISHIDHAWDAFQEKTGTIIVQ